VGKKPKPKTQHVWRITDIRKKGYYVGSVEAGTADEAIKVAMEEFGIENPQRQKRLVAQRES
jgi:hypothetical protein